MRAARFLLVMSLLLRVAYAQNADSLQSSVDPKIVALSGDYWKWRTNEMPFSMDDIPRLERPVGWVADWSAATVEKRRAELAKFESRWKALKPVNGWANRRDEVDYRLTGSAIARARWELDLLRSWRRNPQFYVDQSLDAIHTLLLQPPPFSEARSQEIYRRVKNIPKLLAQ